MNKFLLFSVIEKAEALIAFIKPRMVPLGAAR